MILNSCICVRCYFTGLILIHYRPTFKMKMPNFKHLTMKYAIEQDINLKWAWSTKINNDSKILLANTYAVIIQMINIALWMRSYSTQDKIINFGHTVAWFFKICLHVFLCVFRRVFLSGSINPVSPSPANLVLAQ